MIKSGTSTYTSPPMQLVRQGKGKGCMIAMNVVQECQDDNEDDDDLEGEGQGRTGGREEEEEEEYEEEEELEDESHDNLYGVRRHNMRERVAENYYILQSSLDGGPKNPELLKSFLGHVAYYVWNGKERKVLKGHKQTKRLSKWVINKKEVLAVLSRTKLSHLSKCMHAHLNMPLISAFVERWQPETNSFHLPFGEMTLTLHDVAYILHIPVTGVAVSGIMKLDELKAKLSVLLNLLEAEVKKEYRSGVIKMNTIQKCCSGVTVSDVSSATGYLLWLLGCTLFVDRSTSISPHFLQFLHDLERVEVHAWGAACLAYMYRQLETVTRYDNAQIGGCLTLVQTCIYQYFPVFRPTRNERWSPNMSHALRWFPSSSKKNEDEALTHYRVLLDKLNVDEVCWTPFHTNPHIDYPISMYRGIIHCRTIREPYMSDRVLMQFGYVQVIPANVLNPTKCYRGPQNKKYVCIHNDNMRPWETWLQHCVRLGELGAYRANYGGEVVHGYLDYYLDRAHPQISRTIVSAPRNVHHTRTVESSLMSHEARLQYLGDRLYHLHPEVCSETGVDMFFKCLDDVTRQMEDCMPRLQERRHRRRQSR